MGGGGQDETRRCRVAGANRQRHGTHGGRPVLIYPKPLTSQAYLAVTIKPRHVVIDGVHP